MSEIEMGKRNPLTSVQSHQSAVSSWLPVLICSNDVLTVERKNLQGDHRSLTSLMPTVYRPHPSGCASSAL